LFEEAVDRMLEQDPRFLEAVEEGRADVRRGALLDHAEVVDLSSESCGLEDYAECCGPAGGPSPRVARNLARRALPSAG